MSTNNPSSNNLRGELKTFLIQWFVFFTSTFITSALILALRGETEYILIVGLILFTLGSLFSTIFLVYRLKTGKLSKYLWKDKKTGKLTGTNYKQALRHEIKKGLIIVIPILLLVILGYIPWQIILILIGVIVFFSIPLWIHLRKAIFWENQ